MKSNVREEDIIFRYPSKEEIKAALRGGKLQDLLDMATVSLLKEEPAVSVEEAEDEEPEIEVEVIVDEAFAAEESDETEPEIEVEVFVEEPELSEEDAAFIAEEAAKMEQAEDAGKEEAAAE